MFFCLKQSQGVQCHQRLKSKDYWQRHLCQVLPSLPQLQGLDFPVASGSRELLRAMWGKRNTLGGQEERSPEGRCSGSYEFSKKILRRKETPAHSIPAFNSLKEDVCQVSPKILFVSFTKLFYIPKPTTVLMHFRRSIYKYSHGIT